jgi:CRP/FNR family transcriptional regulator
MTADAILSSFDFYRGASAARRAEYASAATVVHLVEHQTFYGEGDLCPHFGLIGQGDIRVFKIGPGGRELTLYHVRDGEPCLVNMLCVFLSRAAMASAIVEAATDAVVIPAAAIRKWITSDERLRAFAFETMAARLVEVMTLAAEISVSRMDARLAALLLRRTERHADGGTIEATHDGLAGELGTAREVVSRLLKEFERSGALRLGRGHITVTNGPALQDVADSARNVIRS